MDSNQLCSSREEFQFYNGKKVERIFCFISCSISTIDSVLKVETFFVKII